jgi:hypothetical protein
MTPEGILVGIVFGLLVVWLCRALVRCSRWYRDMVARGEATKLYGTGPRGSGERRKEKGENKK